VNSKSWYPVMETRMGLSQMSSGVGKNHSGGQNRLSSRPPSS
jgi:hypothetical protein